MVLVPSGWRRSPEGFGAERPIGGRGLRARRHGPGAERSAGRLVWLRGVRVGAGRVGPVVVGRAGEPTIPSVVDGSIELAQDLADLIERFW